MKLTCCSASLRHDGLVDLSFGTLDQDGRMDLCGSVELAGQYKVGQDYEFDEADGIDPNPLDVDP